MTKPTCTVMSIAAPSAVERHFTPKEIAALWGIHEVSVRRLFIDEPGVLKLGNLSKRSKRSYVTLRIPESVLDHVSRQRIGMAA